ncbi:MAG: DNA recombination protein RmuC [Firmicutes bacterium]|nr:DNA recombination protein RmuC [Alicyclobacillaceae bacterium]MCL6497550.1 DNA recombination protein RmuC [Bacillota bacterium]
MTGTEILTAVSIALNLVVIALLVTRQWAAQVQAVLVRELAAVEKGLERLERALREESAQSREESARHAQLAREELAARLQDFHQVVVTMLDAEGREAARRAESLREVLTAAQQDHARYQRERLEGFIHETGLFLDSHDKRTVNAIGEMAAQQKGLLDTFAQRLAELTTVNERKLEQMRETVEGRLRALQEDNQRKLEEMRATVDEKLHQTLEQRLGESFRLVSERLELVHKGLGEMQTLASGVGDLKKVLSNVKARGTLGEIQLDALLEQTLSPEQYRSNVEIRPGSGARVDFAIVLPGRDEEAQRVLLPIDAKFPLEDYQRLLDAEEQGDTALAQEAGRLLESRIRSEAKSIQEKYLDPPRTTDFAILFLPLEGLFAEVLRRPGLWEVVQREFRVVITGPTTITALLNSLQMGFRTLAIQKRSSEVWKLLGAVKTEFGKFGEILEKTQKKLQEASHTIDAAATRTRQIERRLRQVEALPATEAPALLGDFDPTWVETP